MQKITISRKKLAAALLFAATKDVRYYLNGVNVECYAGRTIIVATDGHCLAALNDQPAEYENEMGGEHCVSLILPSHVCEQFKVTSRTLYDTLTLTIDGENYSLSDGIATVSFKPVDGRFPDFRRVIPDTVSGELAQFDSELLARFGKAAKILSPKRKNGAYGLTIGHNGTGSASVEIGASDFRGVIMPMRLDEPTSRPAWIDAPRAPEPVAETEETEPAASSTPEPVAESAAPEPVAETAEPAVSSTSAARYSCVSVVAGWQTRNNRTGEFIGPAFNSCVQLWDWQAENRHLMPEYDGITDIMHLDETAAPGAEPAASSTAAPEPVILPLVRCAVEVWQASGARTDTRLRSLVEHYATQYSLTDQVDALYDQARRIIPAWQFDETAQTA